MDVALNPETGAEPQRRGACRTGHLSGLARCRRPPGRAAARSSGRFLGTAGFIRSRQLDDFAMQWNGGGIIVAAMARNGEAANWRVRPGRGRNRAVTWCAAQVAAR